MAVYGQIWQSSIRMCSDFWRHTSRGLVTLSASFSFGWCGFGRSGFPMKRVVWALVLVLVGVA